MDKVKIKQIRRNTEPNMEKMNMENEMKEKSTSNDRKVAITGGVIALAIFAFVAFHGDKEKAPAAVTVKQPAAAAQDNSSRVDLSKLVNEKTAAYLEKNRQALAAFEQALATAGREDFEQASRNVDDAVIRVSGFGATSKLCYKMAKDRLVSDSHDASDALMAVMKKPIIEPCCRGCSKIESAYRNFAAEIEENRNQYCADLAQFSQTLKTDDVMPGQEMMLEHLEYIHGKVCDLAMEKMAAAVGIGIEAVCLRSSLRVLSSLCGHIAAKLAGSASTAAVCAVADGPLPFGEIVGTAAFVGGVAWCAWDVRKVCKVLPNELRAAMQNMIRESKISAQNQVKRSANELVVRLENEAADMQKKLMQEINR